MTQHRLLQRLIRKYPNPTELHAAVSNAFYQFDEDRLMLERSLQLTSDELNQINAELKSKIGSIEAYQQELELSLTRKKALLDASPEAVFSFGSQGQVLAVNRAGCDFFQLSEASLKCMSYDAVLKHLFSLLDDVQPLVESLDQISKSQCQQVKGELQTKDGKTYEYVSVAEILGGKYVGRVWCCRDTTAYSQQQAALLHQAYHDVLTGLPNRLLLKETINHAMDKSKRAGQMVALLYIDLDDFKKIKDTEGHGEGDKFLCEVTRRLKQTLRAGDTLGRLSGDEFLIVIDQVSGLEQVEKTAQRIIELCEKPCVINSNRYVVSCSIGISLYPVHDGDAEGLIGKADMAMYRAKRMGKNQYFAFDSQLEVQVVERVTTEAKLREAIRKRQFILHYQPKIDLATTQLKGVEALIRWQMADGSLIYPNHFIAVAEDAGLVSQITELVVEMACEALSRWQHNLLAGVNLSVNLSAVDFANTRFMEKLLKIVASTPANTELLEFELTETALFADLDYVQEIIKEFKNHGVQFSIDDFGTGYSSFGYLQDLDIDFLKIDRSFVQAMATNQKSTAIVKSMIDVGVNLGVKVIAEGIENAHEAERLKSMRCHYGQGYFYAQPCEEEQLLALLMSNVLSTPSSAA